MKSPFWPLPSSLEKEHLNLERIKILLEKLGNPQDKIPPVFHIAGTNGKGSVSSFLKYILEENGYKVHRYTSPHLVDFNERIEISSKVITDEYYNELALECKEVIEKNNLEVSYFEIITAIAFMAFSRKEAIATILEVGLGGRLDATNVINNPLIIIITPISLDHMKILGNTIEEIAVEKAGIFKSGVNSIIAMQQDSVLEIFRNIAKKIPCQLHEYGKHWIFKRINEESCYFEGIYKMFKTPNPGLIGEHQVINAGTAIAALLSQKKIFISEEGIRKGIEKTFWPARLQNLTNSKLKNYVNKDSEIYLDGAHNEDGARVLKEWAEKENEKNKKENIAIVVILERKESKVYAEELSKIFTKIILIEQNQGNNIDQDVKNSKYKSAAMLRVDFVNAGCKNILEANSLKEALSLTKNKSKLKKRIVICGSLYFAGEVLEEIKEEEKK